MGLKVGDRVVVEIAEVDREHPEALVRLKFPGLKWGWWIPEGKVVPHLLPPTLTPEDAAVLEAAERWNVHHAGVEIEAGRRWMSALTFGLFEALHKRAARQSAPPTSTPLTDLERAVVDEFLKLLTPEGYLRLATQTYGDAYPAVAALVALRAAMSPPDPVAELREAAKAVSGMWGPRAAAEVTRLRAALAAMEKKP